MSAEVARRPLIAGNWKMYKTIAEAEEYIQALLPRVSGVSRVDVGICPSFLSLQAMVDSARGSPVQVFAQNMHHAADGAFTGEVSSPMLAEIGAYGVILGHSERRQMFGETDKALALKVPAALEAGLVPILCVGETEEEREAGDTERKLRHQVQEDLARVPTDQLGAVVIAYEPVWAIGSGRACPAEQAQEAIAFVRALVAGRDREQAARTRVLYGGSVKPDNADELLGPAGCGRGARRWRQPGPGGVRRDHQRRWVMASDSLPEGAEGLPAPSVVLVVLDGWGLAPDGEGNAISRASTPVFDELWSTYPHTELTACGRAVGLPEGQMGNSEVGHMNLGAGSVVVQDLTRIDEAASSGEFESNEVLRAAFSDAERVHLIGLVSDGGVHSGWAHLEALIRMGASLEVPDLVLHAFTDGRDTGPKSGAGYLSKVADWMKDAGAGRVGSVVGRYYAMDRDRRWDRIELAYNLLVHGRGAGPVRFGGRGDRGRLLRGRDGRVHQAPAGR